MTPSILIVDDEYDLRETITAFLSRDLKVFQASNGEEAFEFLKTNPVDFILTDIRMPRMDGFELLTKIRSIPNYHPKVIIMTGESPYSQQFLFEHGADHFLAKPFSFFELQSMVCVKKKTA